MHASWSIAKAALPFVGSEVSGRSLAPARHSFLRDSARGPQCREVAEDCVIWRDGQCRRWYDLTNSKCVLLGTTDIRPGDSLWCRDPGHTKNVIRRAAQHSVVGTDYFTSERCKRCRGCDR